MSTSLPHNQPSRRDVSVVLLTALLIGCSSTPAPPPSATATTYTVKGRLESIKPAANGYGFLNIKHEAVPGFRDEKGKVVGMEVMTMPFAYGPGIQTDTLPLGGAVELVFVMDYAAQPMLSVTQIKALPKATKLSL